MKDTTKPKSQLWPVLVITGIGIYVAIDVILAFLRPDYSPLHNAESDYGRGPYFWLMDINFLLRCAFSLALVKAISVVSPKDIFIKKSSYLLVIWAIASGLLAFFADNPYGYPRLASGPIHVLLAFIAFIAAMIGMILLNRRLGTIEGWQRVASLLTAITALAIISILLLGHAGFRPHRLGGLYERVFLGLVLTWEAIVAINIARKSNIRMPNGVAPV